MQVTDRKKVIVAISIIIVVIVSLVWFLMLKLPIVDLANRTNYYLAVMMNLNQTDTMNGMRALFDGSYNYTELLSWEHEKLVFTSGNIERHTDPLEILEYGKGRCQEFAILCVSLCLVHGYQSRLVVDMYGDHCWTEIWLEDRWVHVDPSEMKVDDPYMYERDWNKDLRLVYAFSDGSMEDVTTHYRDGSSIDR